MIACLDVHYTSGAANAAAVVYTDWSSIAPVARYRTTVDGPADYEPRRFYLRELPPLLAVVARIAEPVDVFVIDGYCHLSTDLSPGLGAHFHVSIKCATPVIGIAKRRFHGTDHAIEIL